MYDEYEDEFGEYPPQRQRRSRRRVSLHWKLALALLLVLAVLGLRLVRTEPRLAARPPERMQTVRVVNWQEVDVRIRTAIEDAHDASIRYAEGAIADWTKELQGRVDADFLPWYFAYWNQQALALKAVGYHLADTPAVEAIAGKQLAARERLARDIEEAFSARVLRPQSAQLMVEKVARESVEVYLMTLGDQLAGLQAEFIVPEQEWERHLQGLSGISLAIEGNRAIPVITKAAVAGSGVAAAKVAKVVVTHLRSLVMRMAGRDLLGMGGRYAVRGLGWWVAAGITVWDIADHQHTVQQNLPVLRRSLNGYLNELEEQVLHDPKFGIIQILDGVQRDVLRELKTTEK